MFRLYGEQKILYQWDLNRKLIVEVPCQEVHITNGGDALVLQPYDLDGQTVMEIPNIFLQSSRTITAYAWVEDGDGGFTLCSKLFHIIPRPKPDDYVYTETEVLTWRKLEEQIAQKLSSAGWTPGKFLGTDEKGNVVEKDAPQGGIPDFGQNDYELPVGGDELGGVKNGGNVVINEDGTMTAPESEGISVTGATVGQIVKIAAVDENGVPTEWEPVDMPGGEEWVELVNVTLEEEAIPILDIGDYASNFKKLRFFIRLEAKTPSNVLFALSVPNNTMGEAYIVCTINNFGDASNVSFALIEFEPLIEGGFCYVRCSWAVPPTVSAKSSSHAFQYNSYDYGRLKRAKYFRPNTSFPAGTTITIKGVRA